MSLVKPGILRPVIIPMHREVAVGVIVSCLRTSGLSRDDLLEWLGKL